MSGKLSRRIRRARYRAEYGGRFHERSAPPASASASSSPSSAHYDDGCELCRRAREEGLETYTTTLDNGMTYSTTFVPKGWRD